MAAHYNGNVNSFAHHGNNGYASPPPPAHFADLFQNGNLMEADDDNDPEENEMQDNIDGHLHHNGNQNGMGGGGGGGGGGGLGGAGGVGNLNEPACWVFGYGSLCWYPGFTFNKCITGYIRGYVRRFWQGNVTHRGTEEQPGRVATLIEDKEGITWGCAYRITGHTALDYLKQRECTLGGYATLETKFFPRVASIDTPFSGEAIEVHVYIATPENCHWLGPSSDEDIAKQIVQCRGPSGFNAEYLLRLALFMHEEIPGVHDEHLFDLERLVLEELFRRNIPLLAVMGRNPDRIRRDSHEDIRRPPSFEFTSRIPEPKLRCLNI